MEGAEKGHKPFFSADTNIPETLWLEQNFLSMRKLLTRYRSPHACRFVPCFLCNSYFVECSYLGDAGSSLRFQRGLEATSLLT